MNFTKDFSRKTLKQLASKNINIMGVQAIPAFEGDQYFSGTGYVLNAGGSQIIRTYDQVVVMGSSSWTPECLTVDYDDQFRVAYN